MKKPLETEREFWGPRSRGWELLVAAEGLIQTQETPSLAPGARRVGMAEKGVGKVTRLRTKSSCKPSTSATQHGDGWAQSISVGGYSLNVVRSRLGWGEQMGLSHFCPAHIL